MRELKTEPLKSLQGQKYFWKEISANPPIAELSNRSEAPSLGADQGRNLTGEDDVSSPANAAEDAANIGIDSTKCSPCDPFVDECLDVGNQRRRENHIVNVILRDSRQEELTRTVDIGRGYPNDQRANLGGTDVPGSGTIGEIKPASSDDGCRTTGTADTATPNRRGLVISGEACAERFKDAVRVDVLSDQNGTGERVYGCRDLGLNVLNRLNELAAQNSADYHFVDFSRHE